MTEALARLLSAVTALHDDLDPLLLADAAWLAAALSTPTGPPPSADLPTPLDLPAPSPTTEPPATTGPSPPSLTPVSARSHTDGAPARGFPLSVARPSALPEALALSRALRPFLTPWPRGLRTKLDVEATIDHYARSGTLLPVFNPSPERWFEVVLVVDNSLTMAVWTDLAQALSRVMHDLGAFRAIHIWSLSWQDGAPLLHDHQGHSVPWNRAAQHSGSPQRRRLLLVLTDCAAPPWRQPAPWRMLRTWARSVPLALVNPLPRRLWHRSALDHPPCHAVAPFPTAPTNSWRPTSRWLAPPHPTGQVLPVLTCAPQAVQAWARTVMRADPKGCEAVLVPPEDQLPRTSHETDLVDPSALADAFVRTSPPDAVRLAVLSSTLESFTVPMLKALRERALPETGLPDLAEVLSSGLLTVTRQAGRDPVLAFEPAARERLHQEATRGDARLVHQAMSAHLAEHPYAPNGIPMLLHRDDAPYDLIADATPFAQASVDTQRMLGINTELVAPHTAPSTSSTDPSAVPETERTPATAPPLAGGVLEPDRERGLFRRLLRLLGGRESLPPAILPKLQVQTTGNALAQGQGSLAVTGFMQVNNELPTVHPYALPEPATWPHQVGVLPPRARSFQHRADAARLREVLEPGGSTTVTTLTGSGGVGKTQLAADFARTEWEDGSLDVLVWITASTRSAVVSGYARAGAELCRANPDVPEQAAGAFLAWLAQEAGAECRWLIVLDDLVDPADMSELWPPVSPHGRVLITSRRRDRFFAAQDRLMINIDVFTVTEAVTYLSEALAPHGRDEAIDELRSLALELGCLPLALAHAAAYLIDSGMAAATYHQLFVDRMRVLSETHSGFPIGDALPLATSWALSIDHADQIRPVGLARPMLQLASMLDANGIPENVLTGLPATTYLRQQSRGRSAFAPVSEHDAKGALQALHRVSLIDFRPFQPQMVRVHQMVQRAARDQLPSSQIDELAHTAGNALLDAWPQVEGDAALAAVLRANSYALSSKAAEALYRPRAHVLLYRYGRSLGESGQVVAARDHFSLLAAETSTRLGRDHPDTLAARNSLARWRGEAGDAAGAAAAFAELRADRERVLGSDHPDTLNTSHDLAYWRGMAGDAAGAAAALAEALADRERVLGPDHPETLTTRHDLARWRGELGDAAGAAAAFAEVLADRERVLGSDHPHSLTTRHDLAHWRGMAGDAAGAAAALAEVLADRERVLGSDHPQTLTTRH
ncbi:SAV_2336 N-terminal domain-related protein, partial [Streptomyces virginiae]|uniref:SAV_2336 N-terminal domain-related protein n=1 Tax=Streptomyces virginiae TaxID=1961 RepID=UPI00365C1758